MQNSNIPDTSGMFIMNNDAIGGLGIHWIAGIIDKDKNCVYLYDSFGRGSRRILPYFTQVMIAKGYKVKNADLSDQDQYGSRSVDCGHRCISALSIYAKHGIKAYMKL